MFSFLLVDPRREPSDAFRNGSSLVRLFFASCLSLSPLGCERDGDEVGARTDEVW